MPQINHFIVLFYEDQNGNIPAKAFLLGLNKPLLAKFTSLMAVLQEKGSLMQEPYSRSLEDDIFEFHVNYKNHSTLVLYFFCYGRQILLTNGFLKKSFESTISQLNLAKKFQTDYIERSNTYADI